MKTILLLFAMTASGAQAKKDIAEYIAHSKDLTIFAGALKAAGLMEKLSGEEQYTVFAPGNAAFAKLAPGSVESISNPANQATVAKVAGYHLVPGLVTMPMLKKQLKAGRGTATLKTLDGNTLTFAMEHGKLKIKDEKGGAARLTGAGVARSNGTIYFVDAVLSPI